MKSYLKCSENRVIARVCGGGTLENMPCLRGALPEAKGKGGGQKSSGTNKNQKKLRIVIIVQAIITFILPNFYFLLAKFGGYWSVVSLWLVLLSFIGLSISTILLIFRTIIHSQWRNKFNYFTLATALVFICIYLLPFDIVDISTFPRTIKFTAHYEKSFVFFRTNGKFEVLSVGKGGYAHYSAGVYTHRHDSLFLEFRKIDYTQDAKYQLVDTLIKRDKILYKVQNGVFSTTNYNIIDRKSKRTNY